MIDSSLIICIAAGIIGKKKNAHDHLLTSAALNVAIIEIKDETININERVENFSFKRAIR